MRRRMYFMEFSKVLNQDFLETVKVRLKVNIINSWSSSKGIRIKRIACLYLKYVIYPKQ